MADPLSVAGLVTGVISLGLQVAGGLTNYLDAVKGRSEDLRSAKQGATDMRDLLLTIRDLLPQIESNWPASATTVKRHVDSCHAELGALHALLSELSQPGPSGSGLRSKMTDAKMKLSYPFERPKISRLEERLKKVNSALQTALQVTDLDASMTTANEMRELRAVSIASANQIREIHSLVVSLSQSQISLRTQSVGASVSFTTAREIPAATNGGTRLPLDSIQTAMTFASKPSFLSTSIKALEEVNATQPSSRSLSQVCLCRPSRRITHHQKLWGEFSFSHQMSSTRRHFPDCPLSQIDSETQASKWTLEYFGLRNMCQTAFALSFVNTRGAGGRSISPGFTYYPTVDKETAPAFRLMRALGIFVQTRRDWDEADTRTVQRCFDKIFELYSKKKASPKDITSSGESLMHLIVNVIRYMQIKPFPVTFDLSYSIATNLVACGVPVSTYDGLGRTPVMTLLCAFRVTDSVMDLTRLLLPEPDIPMLQGGDRYSYVVSLFEAILEDAEFAEASGCGLLSLAARAGDERFLQELIQRYPQSLKEENDFGHTPLHLAIKHPPCLRLILEAGGAAMLEWGDCITPLERACRMGYKASVQILLAAGSRITHYCLENCDSSCLDDVLVALKQRRDELKSLALEHLTQAEADSFGLHEEKVLDGCALEVQQLLLERGIGIPPHLCDSEPVYFSGCPISTLDKLWALGFRDIDCCDRLGAVPLVVDRENIWGVRWLVEHGADYWTPFSERSSNTTYSEITATPAHFLSANVELQTMSGYLWLLSESGFKQVQVSDTCFCRCSNGGCTPLKALFDWQRSRKDPLDVQGLTKWCGWLTKTFQASFSEQDLIATVRRVTFDGLQLVHTCCDFSHDYISSYHESLLTLEEVEEINSEPQPLLTLFENILVEFDELAHEDQDGVPLIVHDPEEFWMRRWLPRMEETLADLNGKNLTAEEVSAAEAVGVKWYPQPAQEEEEVERKWEDIGLLEYMMRELEKILNE